MALAIWRLGGAWRETEAHLLDYRYIWRDRLAPHAVPVDGRICIVFLDQDTQKALNAPLSESLGAFGEAIRATLDAGARVAALDFFLDYAQPEQARAFVRPLVEQRGRVVSVGYLQEDKNGDPTVSLPVPSVLAVLGSDNIALANLVADPDGVARATSVFPVRASDGTAESGWPLLAPLLAEKITMADFDKSDRSWQGKPIPTLSPDDARIYINYASSQPDFFPSYSMHQVLEEARAHESDKLHRQFDGKIVLVGPGAQIYQDFTQTPFSSILWLDQWTQQAIHKRSSFIYGVEAHAHILNSLLTRSLLWPVSPWVNLSLLLAMSILTALLSFYMPPLRSGLLTIVVLLAFCAAAVIGFAFFSSVIEMMDVIVAVPLVWGVTFAYRYNVSDAEKRFVRKLFGRYVSEEVMTDLLADPSHLRLGAGERREVTILFADINGFTTVSESRSPEEVIRMLNDFYKEMTAIVFKHKGTLKQFVGDEIMVFYGAPWPHPEPQREAVRTALDMMARLRQLREASSTPGFYDIKIGIHTGFVTLGNIGSEERSEYTAVGDAVNLASRIMNMTKQEKEMILISAETYAGAQGLSEAEFIALGPREVRGRQNAVELYAVHASTGPAVHPHEGVSSHASTR
jgi:class 3 adenylate cyclase/CHASE2 domain-containing sensor protein